MALRGFYLRPIRTQPRKWGRSFLLSDGDRVGLAFFSYSRGGRYCLERCHWWRPPAGPDPVTLRRYLANPSQQVIYLASPATFWQVGAIQPIIDALDLEIEFIVPRNQYFYLMAARRSHGKRYKLVFCGVDCLFPLPTLEWAAGLCGLNVGQRETRYSEALALAWADFLLGQLAVTESFVGLTLDGTTAGNIAWTIFRQHFLTPKDILVIRDQCLAELIDDGTAGGLVWPRCVGKHTGTYYLVDRNNAFHADAATSAVCGVPAEYDSLPTYDWTNWVIRRYPCVARVVLNPSERFYPRKINSREFHYSFGGFTTVLVGEELRYAWEAGDVGAVAEILAFRPSTSVSHYGAWCAEKLKEAKRCLPPAGYALIKRILTSFYGKSAQIPMVVRRRDDILPLIWNGEWYAPGRDGPDTRYFSWDGMVFEEYYDPTIRNSCPQVWSSVTAVSRKRLQDALETAGHENILYADTDGAIVNERGLERLRSTPLWHNGPGGWRQKADATEVEVHAAKHYRYDGIWIVAGKRKPILNPVPVLEDPPHEAGELTPDTTS